MSDDNSLAVAYSLKKRNRKGALTHEPTQEEYSPRKERLKSLLMSQGGAVKEEAVEDYGNLDELFPETDVIEDAPDIEVNPEEKRKQRLMGILNTFEMKK